METRFTVTGMTCAHCATSVTDEVSKIKGVTSVDVDLTTGLITVASDSAPDPAAVAEAVDEAGYSLATS